MSEEHGPLEELEVKIVVTKQDIETVLTHVCLSMRIGDEQIVVPGFKKPSIKKGKEESISPKSIQMMKSIVFTRYQGKIIEETIGRVAGLELFKLSQTFHVHGIKFGETRNVGENIERTIIFVGHKVDSSHHQQQNIPEVAE